jgi:outer membrane autotransporter protein
LLKATTLTGTFANWTPSTLSIAINETLSYNYGAGVVDLVVTQDPLPAIDTPTIYPAITTIAVNEAQSANDTILTRLTELRTEPEVDDMPMADSTTHRPGLSAGRSPYGAWFKGLGGFGSTSSGAGAPGYDMHGGGFITGLDLPLGNSAVAGFAAGYSLTSISENGGASADIDTPRLMAYGGWWHGPIALDGTLGFGYASISSSRPITGTGGTATASLSGTEITGAFQASSPMRFGPIAFTPALGVDYARLGQDSANEGGDGLYDLSVAQSKTNSLRPFVAATVATRFRWGMRNTAIEPQLRVAYAEEVLSTSRQALVQAPGDDQVFAIPGVTPSAGMLSASAGLKIETDRNFAFFSNVNVTDSGNSRSYGADAGIRYRF